jgi:hypothetical protein
MSNTLANILFAVITTVIVLGPALAVLWFSWRAVVVGALAIGALLLFFLSLMGAANAGYYPDGDPYLSLAVLWAIAAGLAFAAYWLAGRGPGVKVLNIVLGLVVVFWAITLRHHVENAWWVVAHPEPPKAKSATTGS